LDAPSEDRTAGFGAAADTDLARAGPGGRTGARRGANGSTGFFGAAAGDSLSVPDFFSVVMGWDHPTRGAVRSREAGGGVPTFQNLFLQVGASLMAEPNTRPAKPDRAIQVGQLQGNL
jgi:hypothetical protein